MQTLVMLVREDSFSVTKCSPTLLLTLSEIVIDRPVCLIGLVD